MIGGLHNKTSTRHQQLGHLLRDAKTDDLIKPGRELDHQLFQAHLDDCAACRSSMLDHASETAIKQVAVAKGMAIDDVMNDLVQASQTIQEGAQQEGVPFAEMLKRVVTKSQRMAHAHTNPMSMIEAE